VDATAEEVAEIRRRKDEYYRDKATQKLTTRYGLQYSPHYSQQSQLRNPKGGKTAE
jgi:hypothetical protein